MNLAPGQQIEVYETKPGEALPCPFCGESSDLTAAALLLSEDGDQVFQMMCNSCGAYGPVDLHIEEEGSAQAAISSWNTRDIRYLKRN